MYCTMYNSAKFEHIDKIEIEIGHGSTSQVDQYVDTGFTDFLW